MNKQQADEIEALKAKLKGCEEKCAAMEPQLENVAGLHKQLKDAKREREKAVTELEALQKKSESEKKTLKSIAAQKDKKSADLQKRLDEITGSNDAAAQVVQLSNEVGELKRQLEEGGGMPVENGDYEAYAEVLKSDDVSAQAAGEKVGKLSPAEAARVIQAMGDWTKAAELLRATNSIDFISTVLTCGVLDETDVAAVLSQLGDIEGTVFFAMIRKTVRWYTLRARLTQHGLKGARVSIS